MAKKFALGALLVLLSAAAVEAQRPLFSPSLQQDVAATLSNLRRQDILVTADEDGGNEGEDDGGGGRYPIFPLATQPEVFSQGAGRSAPEGESEGDLTQLESVLQLEAMLGNLLGAAGERQDVGTSEATGNRAEDLRSRVTAICDEALDDDCFSIVNSLLIVWFLSVQVVMGPRAGIGGE